MTRKPLTHAIWFLWVTSGVLLVVLLSVFAFLLFGKRQDSTTEFHAPVLGNPDAVAAGYSEWAEGQDDKIVLPLKWVRGLPGQRTEDHGRFDYDLISGKVQVQIGGYDGYNVWAIDGQFGSSIAPEEGDRCVLLGSLKDGKLNAWLDRAFNLELVAVAPPGKHPKDGSLYGLPSLYQVLYLEEHNPSVIRTAAFGSNQAKMKELIMKGSDLFFRETFMGNGRTCGTCHPATNNYTLDVEYISKLLPNDPLFVAETNPALAVNFENPFLMRTYALILENVDGTDDLPNKFVMRGVPHTLALQTSLNPAPIDGTSVPPIQRTGWSGDGAPGMGSLREFAIGAVMQHFPRTLNRISGVDFRLPTANELTALEAFQLALGRQKDIDITAIPFKNEDAIAGVAVFNGRGKCFRCHANAGANHALDLMGVPNGTQNLNVNTGVEEADHPANANVQLLTRDGGFGRVSDGHGGFGDGTFNTPSLIEAADTAPFFHNNLSTTLRDAIEFYDPEEGDPDTFAGSPGSAFVGGIDIEEEEEDQLEVLLRLLNVLENIRQSVDNAGNVKSLGTRSDDMTIDVILSDVEDAIQVLENGSERVGKLHPDAVIFLKAATLAFVKAKFTNITPLRDRSIAEGVVALNTAASTIVFLPGEKQNTRKPGRR